MPRLRVPSALRRMTDKPAASDVVSLAVARHTNVFIAGCWAGFLQCLVLSPFEHVKCQLQVMPLAMIQGPISCLSASHIATRSPCSPRIIHRIASTMCLCQLSLRCRNGSPGSPAWAWWMWRGPSSRREESQADYTEAYCPSYYGERASAK